MWLGTNTGCRVCAEHRGDDGETIAERYTRLKPHAVKLGD